MNEILCIRREPNQGAAAYAVVDRFEGTFRDAVRQYRDTYSHDDRSGTEVIFIDGDHVHVVHIIRPPAPVEMVTATVRQLVR